MDPGLVDCLKSFCMLFAALAFCHAMSFPIPGPDSTAYWNALVHGRKRWMFLKPEDSCHMLPLLV